MAQNYRHPVPYPIPKQTQPPPPPKKKEMFTIVEGVVICDCGFPAKQGVTQNTQSKYYNQAYYCCSRGKVEQGGCGLWVPGSAIAKKMQQLHTPAHDPIEEMDFALPTPVERPNDIKSTEIKEMFQQLKQSIDNLNTQQVALYEHIVKNLPTVRQ